MFTDDDPNREDGDTAPDSNNDPRVPILPPSESVSRQLTLFQTFYAPANQRHRMSNVIEIWDAAPKFATPRRRADVTDNPAVFLERTFNFRGTRFQVTVAPALIKDWAGRNAYRFPTAREELVEDALRKIAVQQHLGFVGTLEAKPIVGVRFSLKMLRRELARHGHGIKHADLVESLMILSGSVVNITYAGRRTALHRNTILANLAAISREDYLRDPQTLWSAHFHPMVAGSLSAVTYRQYDYEATMSYRSSLARWLHKYLAAVFVNAGMTQPCRIMLSEIRDGSGLVNRATVRHQARDVEHAINELISSAYPIVRFCNPQVVLEGRCILDVNYTLQPTPEFVRLVIDSNKRQKDTKSMAADSSARRQN